MEPKTCNEKLPNDSLIEILGRLAVNSANLIRDEIELVKQQAREKIKDLRNGIIILALGWIFIVGSLWSFSAALVLVLCLYMPPGCAAATAGIALAVIGGVIFYLGIRKFKKTCFMTVNQKEGKT